MPLSLFEPTLTVPSFPKESKDAVPDAAFTLLVGNVAVSNITIANNPAIILLTFIFTFPPKNFVCTQSIGNLDYRLNVH